MKKHLLISAFAIAAAFILALTPAVLTQASEPMAHIESSDFVIDFLGSETVEESGQSFLFLYWQYTNARSETSDPTYHLTIDAYQHGVELDYGFAWYSPEGYSGPSTKVRPGGTVLFYYPFELRDNEAPVEIEAYNYMEKESAYNYFTLDLKGGVIAPPDVSDYYVEPSSTLGSEILDRIAALEEEVAALKEELEALKK